MNRRQLVLKIIIAVLIVTAGTAIAAEHKRIDREELKAMMTDGRGVVIVDVREPWLFAREHIPGAINIPYDGAHSRILEELKPEDRVVFVCHGGPMGDELGRILVDNGYPEVYNLKGGMRH